MGDMAELYDYFFHDDEYEGCRDMDKYCVVCHSLMKTIKGKHGKFRGCSSFPKCKHTGNWQEFGKIVDNSDLFGEGK